jgi:hypothetical protein
MPRKRDSIPTNDADFEAWFNVMNQYVAQKCSGSQPAWNHIPQEAWSALQDVYTVWNDAFIKTLSPHTKVDTEAKNDAKKSAIAKIRPFVNQYLRFSPVTNEDRTAMAIHNHKDTRTPIPIPTTAPQLLIDTGTRRRLIISYRDEGSDRRGKPNGVHGIEVKWAVLTAPPADIAELTNSSFDTNPPLVLEFEEHERGNKVFLCGRWEILREAGKGPFGGIEEAVIP